MRPLTVLTALEVAATALWTGASAGFAFISAPVAFKTVGDRDQFASITEQSLARLTTCANIAGGIAVAAAAIRQAPLRASLGTTALSLLAVHQRLIVPAMTRAQAAMGSLNDVPEEHPQRIAYRSLHQQSTRIFGAALLLGAAQLMLAATAASD